MMICKLMWLVSIVIFTLTGLRIFNADCGRLAQTRGYDEPAPITYTEALGWQRVPGKNEFYVSPVLGRIEMLASVSTETEDDGAYAALTENTHLLL
jgi:hypothetical protein